MAGTAAAPGIITAAVSLPDALTSAEARVDPVLPVAVGAASAAHGVCAIRARGDGGQGVTEIAVFIQREGGTA